jgi:fructokinase
MRIGIDLGGTKIEAIALADDNREMDRQRVATPRGDYAGTIRCIRDLVAGVEARTGKRGSIGIGIPGSLSPATGLMRNANSTWLNGRPFDRDLETALGRPIRVANDANCLALSEAADGAGAGVSTVFAVILGTGVGGGLVVDGRLIDGSNRIAGEWGHNPLPDSRPDERPGAPCFCGRSGCIETFLSGPGLARDHLTRTGDALTAEEICARSATDDAAAEASVARYEERLARALGSVINLFDPDIVVVGGGMSKVGRLFDNVPITWRRYIFSDVVRTKLAPAKHGDSSGVRGAAWLWPTSS